ncbi:enhancer of split mgamma protein-like isoform X1 [Aphis gossypii]|uniref:enhancer of split mgamma protein-like isoform X1 n=2 Tax=Aphis gossypii TaxID=80765 RepID=UPI002159A6A7|nr:enhancer of split mgamma protein-like isoform X1 [Aphis gossypii]
MFSPTPSPISRTVTYRKITKPLLERKRRARINRCLDELKDLMFSALEAEGENVDKLEKADILEFTVKHLQKITRRDPVEEAYKFQEGFSHCASEACSFLLSLPGLDSVVGRRLVEYLAKSVSRALESQLPAAAAAATAAAAAAMAATDKRQIAPAAASDDRTPPTRAPDNTPPTPPPSASTVFAPPCQTGNAAEAVHFAAIAAASPTTLKPVALNASNRGPPHTVVRPKPTRPAFGRSPPTLQQDAAAAAALRDPMWRPW